MLRVSRAPIIARVAADPGKFVLKSAVRAAIVMPAAFALSLVVVDDKQMALFAAFGSMSLLVFVDFGGTPAERLRAFVILVLAGAAMIALGTLCSHSTSLAALAMALVAFVVLFAGVLNDYIAAASSAALLTFVLAVMVPASASGIPMRLAGWGLAGLLGISATLLLWPARPRNSVLQGAGRAAARLADLVQARSSRDERPGDPASRAARDAALATRDRLVAMTQRPSGTAGATAALARLVEDLLWLNRIANLAPALSAESTPCAIECAEIEAAVPDALRRIAAGLDGPASPGAFDVTRLAAAHEAFGHAQVAHFRAMAPDRDEAEATIELDEAYRLRQLAYGTLQAARDGLLAAHLRPDDRGPHPTVASRVERNRRLLRAHTSMSSVWMRNSLRGAAGLALAVLVGKFTDLQNGFWIVLGTMSVLRSSALATGASIARALVGTLAGIIIGGLIVIAVGGNRGVLWAVLPVAVLVAAYAPQAISFAAGQAAFTVVVLILFNLIAPAGWRVGIVRFEDIAAGTLVSLLVGLLIWPRGADAILREAIGAAYVAAARYLDATITVLIGSGDPATAALAGREAFDSAQLLDTAVRDYLANRSVEPGRLRDLTVLTSGASRVRRVARLLQVSHALWRLAPPGEEVPRLTRARDVFDAQRRARCDWYASFGTAISQLLPAHEPEGEQTWAREHHRSVVLDRSSSGGDAQPGLAIAWAQRHLEVLAAIEPVLARSYGRIDHDGDGGEAEGERESGRTLAGSSVAQALR